MCSRRAHQRLGAAMASMIGSAQVDLEMLDQRGRRSWDTYTARLGDALDAAACRPCLNDPTFMVERRESELALTADRLSGAITRSVGAFRSSFERLPERLAASTSGLDGQAPRSRLRVPVWSIRDVRCISKPGVRPGPSCCVARCPVAA